jgi:DNA repair protein RecO
MSYQVYRTEAFVLGGNAHGEGSRMICLFTKEFGMITALAQGVREIKSKLRYHLQPYSCAEVTLVRGKEIWRLTGASANDFESKALLAAEKRVIIAKIFTLIKRLVVGEHEDKTIFEDVRRAFEFLGREDLTPEELAGMEIVLALRLLFASGYLRNDGQFAGFLQPNDWNRQSFSSAYGARNHAVAAINNSLRESQL